MMDYHLLAHPPYSPQDSYSLLGFGVRRGGVRAPLVMGSAAGWRRLGEGPSVQAGCWRWGDRRDAVEGKGSQVLCE